MTLFKRIIALIVFASTVLTAIACAENTDTDEHITERITESTTDDGRIYPDLPEETFDNKEFWILQWYRGENHPHNYFEYYVEEEIGEVLNDAIYFRNKTIEDRYKVVIKADGVENPAETIRMSTASFDFKHHFVADIPRRLLGYSMSGEYLELSTIPYLDISKPWWNENSQKAFSMNGRLYVISGDYVLYEKQRVFAIIFNRDMADEFHLGDLYAVAQKGNWTVEEMLRCVKIVTEDVNSDGWMDYDDDRFGFMSGSYTYISSLLFGMGNRFSEKDSEDIPYMVAKSERMYDSIEKLSGVIFSDNTLWGEVVTNNWVKAHSPAFVFNSGNTLFYHEILYDARNMDTDIEYGILPQPKYDSEQTDYYTTVQYGNSGAIAIPKNNNDLDFTGIILEALAAESRYTTYPTFVETVLKVKDTPDEQAKKMLDVIFDGIVYDVADAFDFGGIVNIFNNKLYHSKQNNMYSNYDNIERYILDALEDTVDRYEELEY